MLEDKDIQKLKGVFLIKEEFNDFRVKVFEVFPTREEIVTKKDFEIFREEMRNEFSKLLSAIDAYAKKVDVLAQEMVMLAHKVDRHEKWLHQIAEKFGIKLEY